jgi:hypothetical protein
MCPVASRKISADNADAAFVRTPPNTIWPSVGRNRYSRK